MLAARAAKGLEEEVERGVRIPVGRGFAGRVAAERGPVQITDVDHADILNPLLREKGLQSLLGVPMLAEERLVGVLHVGALTKRLFPPDEVDLLQRAADRAALAIGARLYERQRGLAEEIQRSLFPRPLPEFPGVSLAARYWPAASAPLGGDWYDAFLLPSGSLGLVMGDVVGRGFRAAALMGQLRSRAAGLRLRRQRAVGADDQAQHAAAADRPRGQRDPAVPGVRLRGRAGAAGLRGPPPAVAAPGRRGLLRRPPAGGPPRCDRQPDVRGPGAGDPPAAGARPVHRRAHGAGRRGPGGRVRAAPRGGGAGRAGARGAGRPDRAAPSCPRGRPPTTRPCWSWPSTRWPTSSR